MPTTSESIVWELKHEVMTEMAREGLVEYGPAILDEPSELTARDEQVDEVVRRICQRTGLDEKRVEKIIRVDYGYRANKTLFGINQDNPGTHEGLRYAKRGEVGIPGVHHQR